MPAKNKNRGNRLERKIVNMAKGLGLSAQRAWGSDGRALGMIAEVDCVIDGLTFQCKKRKTWPEWMTVPDGVDYQVIERNYGEPMIVMPMIDYLTLLAELSGNKEDQNG
jgi:hypothetical protein